MRIFNAKSGWTTSISETHLVVELVLYVKQLLSLSAVIFITLANLSAWLATHSGVVRVAAMEECYPTVVTGGERDPCK